MEPIFEIRFVLTTKKAKYFRTQDNPIISYMEKLCTKIKPPTRIKDRKHLTIQTLWQETSK